MGNAITSMDNAAVMYPNLGTLTSLVDVPRCMDDESKRVWIKWHGEVKHGETGWSSSSEGSYIPLSHEVVVRSVVEATRRYFSEEKDSGACDLVVDGVSFNVDVAEQTATATGSSIPVTYDFFLFTVDDYRKLRLCSSTRILFHQTSFAAADSILSTQEMRRGIKGLAGGGIYFADSAAHTEHKAIKKGVILNAFVLLGRVKTIDVNGDPSITGQSLLKEGYDSVLIPRVNGVEYVVYFPDQVNLIVEISRGAEGDYDPGFVPLVPLLLSAFPGFFVAPTIAMPSSSATNAWNAFQREHGGLGWTRSEMLSAYKASKRDGDGSNAWNAFQRQNAGKGWSRDDMLSAYKRNQPSASAGVPANSWNAFQHAHAGQGYSREELHDMYTSQSRDAPRAATTGQPDNAWNAFQHAHAGQGYSRDDLRVMYYAGGTSAPAASSSPSNSWNVFQQAHGGQGYSRDDMRSMYYATAGGGSGGGSRPSNSWNAFQQAHGGQGYSRDQMRAMYQRSRR